MCECVGESLATWKIAPRASSSSRFLHSKVAVTVNLWALLYLSIISGLASELVRSSKVGVTYHVPSLHSNGPDAAQYDETWKVIRQKIGPGSGICLCWTGQCITRVLEFASRLELKRAMQHKLRRISSCILRSAQS